MNHLSKKLALNISALLFSVFLLGSCSKSKDDDNGGGGYPKEVTIEYKVKKTSGNLNGADLILANETGGNEIIDNAALPFSKKFKKTVKEWEVIQIAATASGGGGLQLDILVNDQVVETKTGSGTNVLNVQAAYQFKP